MKRLFNYRLSSLIAATIVGGSVVVFPIWTYAGRMPGFNKTANQLTTVFVFISAGVITEIITRKFSK
jgi:hypothetical protein